MRLSEAVNSKGKTSHTDSGDQREFKVTYLSLDELVPSKYNFYAMSDLDSLADAIEIEGGIIQPVVVRRIAPHRYEIVSGHRRCAASQMLVDRGLDQFRMIPCRIEDGNELYTRLNIILSNSMREKTPAEKAREVAELREILKDLAHGSEEDRKKFASITHVSLEAGQNVTERMLRTLVSRQEGISETNYNRIMNIERNLHPELKNKFTAGQIGITAAAALASETPEEQENVNADLDSRIEAGETKLRIPKKKAEMVPDKPADRNVSGTDTTEAAKEFRENMPEPETEESVSETDTVKAEKEFHENISEPVKEESVSETDTPAALEETAEEPVKDQVIVLDKQAKDTIKDFLALYRSYTADSDDWADLHMRLAELFEGLDLD